MNQEKMGRFIQTLRKENNLTQEELASKLNIGREAVSKWERGKTCPDQLSLLNISELFNVSINELLYGSKINKNNEEEVNSISLKLYQDKQKRNKIIVILSVILSLFIILFLLTYFMNNYNTLKLYEVSGENGHIKVDDGIIVQNKDMIYVNIKAIYNNLYIDENYYITNLELYTLNNNIKDFIGGYKDNIIIFEYNGYNEYFDFKDINNILNNLYIDVTLNDGQLYTLKLNLNLKYSNHHLVPFKVNNI